MTDVKGVRDRYTFHQLSWPTSPALRTVPSGNIERRRKAILVAAIAPSRLGGASGVRIALHRVRARKLVRARALLHYLRAAGIVQGPLAKVGGFRVARACVRVAREARGL